MPPFRKCTGMSWKVFPEPGEGVIGCAVTGTGLVSVFAWEPAGFSWQVRERRGTAAARRSRRNLWEKQLQIPSGGEGSESCWDEQRLGRGCVLTPRTAEGWACLGSSDNDSFSPDVWPDVLDLVLLSDDPITSSSPQWQIWKNCGFPGRTAAKQQHLQSRNGPGPGLDSLFSSLKHWNRAKLQDHDLHLLFIQQHKEHLMVYHTKRIHLKSMRKGPDLGLG